MASSASDALLVQTAWATALAGPGRCPGPRGGGQPPTAAHDPGKEGCPGSGQGAGVGRDCLADMAVLRAQRVLGRVMSDPTVSRTVDGLAAGGGAALTAITGAAAAAWANDPAGPGVARAQLLAGASVGSASAGRPAAARSAAAVVAAVSRTATPRGSAVGAGRSSVRRSRALKQPSGWSLARDEDASAAGLLASRPLVGATPETGAREWQPPSGRQRGSVAGLERL